MCLTVLFCSIVNMLDLPFVLDLVRASWLGYMTESVFQNQQCDSTATSASTNVTTNSYVNVSLLSPIA
jgi:hypothetical protein